LAIAIGSNVFRRVTLKNQAGYLLPGPVRQNKFVRTESQLDRYLTFGTRQKSSDRLAHQGPGPKSRALLTGVNAPIVALQ
jgi:hypothetical protein